MLGSSRTRTASDRFKVNHAMINGISENKIMRELNCMHYQAWKVPSTDKIIRLAYHLSELYPLSQSKLATERPLQSPIVHVIGLGV